MSVASIKVVWWASVRDADGGIGSHGVEIVCGIGSGGEAKGRIVAVLERPSAVAGVVVVEAQWIWVMLSGRGKLGGDQMVQIVVGNAGRRGRCASSSSSSRVPTGAKILLFSIAFVHGLHITPSLVWVRVRVPLREEGDWGDWGDRRDACGRGWMLRYWISKL